MTSDELERSISELAEQSAPSPEACRAVVLRLVEALEEGAVRAAEPDGRGGWRVHAWVKRGLLLGFRTSPNVETSAGEVFFFRDREAFPTARGHADRNVRVVPGGTTIRRGAHLAQGVVVMPPAYVNVGAFVGRDTMIDSHALVGSCAQIGDHVHLSAAAQIGGVLEPVGALPVIVEDRVFVGGGCGIYEGTLIGAGAVLAPGVILSRGTPVYDLVRGEILRAGRGASLAIPPGAVVVPGSRPVESEAGRRFGVHLQTPIIVKYRDGGTDAALELEGVLR